MSIEQDKPFENQSNDSNNNSSKSGLDLNNITGDSTENTPTTSDEVLSGGYMVKEVANNDGSIIETLDTAFHNEPGLIKDHSIAGSNRADYYESRSYGKSDVEEELDALNKQQPE